MTDRTTPAEALRQKVQRLADLAGHAFPPGHEGHAETRADERAIIAALTRPAPEQPEHCGGEADALERVHRYLLRMQAAADDERVDRDDDESITFADLRAADHDRARLVEALEPFAREAEDWPDKTDNDELPAEATDIRVGDLRRALKALARKG